MKKLFSKILVLSLLLSGNALSEMPKFFGIVIGGTKAAELLKKDITFVKELKQLNYGTHKSYILDLKDPKSDYFYYFNYDTIKLNPKFQNSAKWRPTCRNCSTVPSPLHRLHVLSKSR
jgi:hypothetical protein